MEESNSYFTLQQNRETCFLSDYLGQVFANNMFCDLKIICSDGQLVAHCCVLAATSHLFRDLVREAFPTKICLYLPDYRSHIVKKVLELLYTGTTQAKKSEENDLVELMSQLEISGYSEIKIDQTVEILNSSVNEKTSMNNLETPSNKSFSCKFCGQILKTRTGLRLHLLAHEGLKGKVFTCDVCGKGFSQASQLKTHFRIHTGEKPFTCEICAKSFSHASTLSEHKNLHNANKPFQCTICKQSFAQRKALRAHQCQGDQMMKNKSFPCPFCKRLFTTKRGLAIHGMHQHSQASSEPILKCDCCGVTFSCEISFELHMSNHLNL